MKKLLTIALAICLSGGMAMGELAGEADAHMYVNVVSNIAVGVVTSNVNLGQVQIGVFPGQIIFRVDANVEQVAMCVQASNLYKGDVASSIYLIPVKTGLATDGALVQPALGNAIAGHGNLLAWLAGVVQVNGFNGVASECWTFESSQGGHFSQDVTVNLEYDQIDPELPKGEYSGWVKLIATVLP